MSISSFKTLFFLITAGLATAFFSCSKTSTSSDNKTKKQTIKNNKTADKDQKTADKDQLAENKKVESKSKTEHTPCANAGQHTDCPHAKKQHHHTQNSKHKDCPKGGETHEDCPHAKKKASSLLFPQNNT